MRLILNLRGADTSYGVDASTIEETDDDEEEIRSSFKDFGIRSMFMAFHNLYRMKNNGQNVFATNGPCF